MADEYARPEAWHDRPAEERLAESVCDYIAAGGLLNAKERGALGLVLSAPWHVQASRELGADAMDLIFSTENHEAWLLTWLLS